VIGAATSPSLPTAHEHDGREFAVEVAEQKRWLTWFGSPALVAAALVAIAFGTGEEWVMGPAVGAIIVDIGIMVWLALSSDTNAGPSSAVTPHH
jgi:hypothetical protein